MNTKQHPRVCFYPERLKTVFLRLGKHLQHEKEGSRATVPADGGTLIQYRNMIPKCRKYQNYDYFILLLHFCMRTFWTLRTSWKRALRPFPRVVFRTLQTRRKNPLRPSPHFVFRHQQNCRKTFWVPAENVADEGEWPLQPQSGRCKVRTEEPEHPSSLLWSNDVWERSESAFSTRSECPKRPHTKI